MISVLFVCLGNICRSPTAHGVFEQIVQDRQLQHAIRVDSAGTAGWHIGKKPDPRSIATAGTKGYDLSRLRSRQVQQKDFADFDYILAMDNDNLADLENIKPSDFSGELSLLLNYVSEAVESEVPDPYYGDGDGFQHVLNLVEQASNNLLDSLIDRHGL